MSRLYLCLFFEGYGGHRDLHVLTHSFPTRRSSDLQYLSFFLLPNEAYVFCRRTGYPRNGSTYYRMEEFNEPIPRRFWINDPGEVNRANWESAYETQGFTLRAVDAQTLSEERVWYDRTAHAFGEGQ